MARQAAGLLHRANEPGVLYNFGNVLGFSAGLIAAVWLRGVENSGGTVVDGMIRHLAGSHAALALTAATAIFFGAASSTARPGPTVRRPMRR